MSAEAAGDVAVDLTETAMRTTIVKSGVFAAGVALALIGAEEVAGADEIVGTPGDDSLTDTPGDDTVTGGDGHDYIESGDGDDVLDGGEGDDAIDSGRGDDILIGGPGDDILSEYSGGHPESESGDDVAYGGDGDDFIELSGGDDTVYGEAGDDEIYGDPGNDVLDGGDGDDYIEGEEGHDVVIGGPGADDLFGDEPSSDGVFDPDEDGHDVVCGDAADTTVTGGDGVDLPCGVATVGGAVGGGIVDGRGLGPLSGTISIERMLDDDGVTGDASLVEGPIAYVTSTAPTKGTLVVDAATGAFTYTPFADATGSDFFEISLSRLIGAGTLPDLPAHLVFDGTDLHIQYGTGLFEVLLPAPTPVTPVPGVVVPTDSGDPTVIQIRDAQQLPVTGSTTGTLAGFGGALLALGAALHFGSRRYQPKHLAR